MVKSTTIALLIMYTSMLFGYGLASGVHAFLHLTADIIAIHDHDHDHIHDVSDHGKIFEEFAMHKEGKSSELNLISLAFCFHSSNELTINASRSITEINTIPFLLKEGLTLSPPTPPPLI